MTNTFPTLPTEPAILRTKLLPPREQEATVPREGLLARMDTDPGRTLTLVTAPAGYGKTTLVSQWLRRRSAATDIAWLSLEADDDSPRRFWRYLISACQTVTASIGRGALTLLMQGRSPAAPLPLRDIVRELSNDIAQYTAVEGTSLMLALDDYHVITRDVIHASLGELIIRLPAACQIVIATRETPPLPLVRLRAHGEVLELNAETLRFSRPEAEQLLTRSVPWALSPEVVEHVWKETEGWVVGLRTAALTLSAASAPPEHPALHKRELFEYLVTEVLDTQTDDVQAFLLQTSLFDRLTGGLCDAVSGRSDSAMTLATLARRNLFLSALGGDEAWYRYHALFASAMRHEAARRFGAGEIRTLNARASDWFAQAGMIEEAIDCTLRAQRWEQAVAWIERVVSGHHLSDPTDPHQIRRWLEQLPTPTLHQRPLLCFALAISLVRTGGPRLPGMIARLERLGVYAEVGWRREENHERLGDLFAARALFRMWDGDMHAATLWARKALECLPVGEVIWRPICLGFAGHAALKAGRIEEARRIMEEAHAGSAAAGNGHATRAHSLGLAQVAIAQSDLRLATALFRQVLADAEAAGDLSDVAPAQAGLARLAYESNDLHAAEALARSGLDTAEHVDAPAARVEAGLLLARVARARNDSAAALDHVAGVLAALSPHRMPEHYFNGLRLQATLLMSLSDTAGAGRSLALMAAMELPHGQPVSTLLTARLRLAEGAHEAALQRLEGIAERADAEGDFLRGLEARLLVALAQHAEGHVAAIETMHTVLVRAHSRGMQRFLLDEGMRCEALLRETLPVVSDPAVREYALTIVQQFILERHEGEGALLSPQEQRVLTELATGCSYQELAKSLVVSVNTVKTQLRQVYRKLGARSRGEAVAIARRVGLL